MFLKSYALTYLKRRERKGKGGKRERKREGKRVKGIKEGEEGKRVKGIKEGEEGKRKG